jgi:hypothetical protein
MAKKQRKVKAFSIQGFDAAHYKTTEQYANAVETLFDRATAEIAKAAAAGTYDPDKPFSFADYPGMNKTVQKVASQLAGSIIVVIESGSKKQWLFACKKNDAFLSSIMDTSKVSKARLSKMQDRNLDALSSFQERKVDGMDLSQRVWKYVGQYKEQLESALDVGLGEGRSAQQLARDVKQNLRDPNRLFRRVRDKRGNLVLSKNAQAFHPGRGVYRSSVKNAQRLTRSEINMAYRESDYQRWQQLDFVVGFEIHRSNHEPLCKCKLCERLKGRYPKWFKFKGWHPQCMCYCTPILMDEETFDENELGDLKAALYGTEYKHKTAKNAVIDVPDDFKAWVKENVDAQENWGSTPYFIKDNFVDGSLAKGLKQTPQVVDPLAALRPAIETTRALIDEWGLISKQYFESLIEKQDIPGIQRAIQNTQQSVDKLNKDRNQFHVDAQALFKEISDSGLIMVGKKEYNTLYDDYTYSLQDKKWFTSNQWRLRQDMLALREAFAKEKQKLVNKEQKKQSDQDDKQAMADWYARSAKATDIVRSTDDAFIESSLGITKGVAMTFDEANSNRGNPLYAKKWIPNPNGAYSNSKGDRFDKNPAYKKQYTINCQTCVVAHELRRRGFDVQARGYSKKDLLAVALARHTELAWLDANGNVPASKITKGLTVQAHVEDLKRFTAETGRYNIHWKWAGTHNGHIITCERLSDGTLRIYDPQTGAIVTDAQDYLKEMSIPYGVYVLRVDNLKFNTYYTDRLIGNKQKRGRKK